MAIGDIDRARHELDVTDQDYRQAAGSYADYLLRARKRFERAEVVTVRQVREVYRRAAQRVRDAVRTVTPETLRERHLLALAKALDSAAEALRGQLDSVLRSGIQLAVDIAVQPAEQITMEALGDAFDRVGVRAMFTNVNQRAVTALLSRTRGDGLRLSDRVWRTSQTWRRAANRVIEDMVARGQNSREAARYIDRYLQPQTHTVLKAETRRRLGVPKDVSMEAMRLAVTEMNNAFHEGTIMAGRATPSYQGIHWRLSHSHVVPDVCDRLAAGSPYRKGEEPSKPHPWCRCVAIQVHEDTKEFMQRLRAWVENPESQPDLEKWYTENAKPFVNRPLVLTNRYTFGGGNEDNPPNIEQKRVENFREQVRNRIEQGIKTDRDAIEVGRLIRREVERRQEPIREEIERLKDEIAVLNEHLLQMTDQSKLQAEYDVYNKKYLRLMELRRKLRESKPEFTREVLSEIRPMGNPGEQSWVPYSEESVKQAIAEVSKYFPSDWLLKSNPMKMMGLLVDRGYYRPMKLATMALSGGASLHRVAIHEMGHRFEHIIPGILELEKQFYERRTAGEELQWLGPGYDTEEMTRFDKFVSPYMGKDYGGRAYEILSMGLESIFAGSYDLSADPEFEEFILGVMAGI